MTDLRKNKKQEKKKKSFAQVVKEDLKTLSAKVEDDLYCTVRPKKMNWV